MILLFCTGFYIHQKFSFRYVINLCFEIFIGKMKTIFEVEAKRQKQSLHTSEVSRSQNVTIEGSIQLNRGCGSVDSGRIDLPIN